MAFWKKYVFMQALLLTIVMFLIGMYVGIVFEDKNLDKTEALFSQSEISLMDIVSLNNIADSEEISCEILVSSNFEVADKIYREALLLEDYEKAGRITDNLIYVHRKYDLLRTYLWMNAIKTKERCPEEFSTVVYLYNYELEDLTVRAKQTVWSKILFELKSEMGGEVLLIPIANSDDFISLKILTENYQIREYPVLIINEEHVLYNLTSAKDLQQYLN
jgi:hypothetical protein